jgi:hypothetical protein
MRNVLEAIGFGWNAYKGLRKGNRIHQLALPQATADSIDKLCKETLRGFQKRDFYVGAIATFASLARYVLDNKARIQIVLPDGQVERWEMFNPERDNIIPFPTRPK